MNQKLVNMLKEEAFINRLLAINSSPKVIQASTFSINNYKKDMISVGNNKKNKKIR